MYELLRRNFVAALTPEGVPSVDVLISDLDGGHLASLQVKTASAPRGSWPLGTKSEKLVAERLFYCFVMPKDAEMSSPDCWIVPSGIVAEHVKASHQTWLAGEPKRGSARKDGERRAMHKKCDPLDQYPEGWMDRYKNNWEIIRS
jgi:hypothetical protein